jgi:hypothetical protein
MSIDYSKFDEVQATKHLFILHWTNTWIMTIFANLIYSRMLSKGIKK